MLIQVLNDPLDVLPDPDGAIDVVNVAFTQYEDPIPAVVGEYQLGPAVFVRLELLLRRVVPDPLKLKLVVRPPVASDALLVFVLHEETTPPAAVFARPRNSPMRIAPEDGIAVPSVAEVA
jgi:hypothetical protein